MVHSVYHIMLTMRRQKVLHLVLMIHHVCQAFSFKGYVQTVAGGGTPHQGGKTQCFDADNLVDGVGSKARFSYPWGITYHEGTLYVSDCSCPESTRPNQNEKIRKIDIETGGVNTVAGGATGFRDGPVKQAQFYHVSGMVVNPAASNIMYAVDSGNSRIRKVDLKSGIVSTIAGSKTGFVDGIGSKALFNNPQSIIFDATKNRLLVGDTDNHAIRIISLNDVTVTTLTGGKKGFKDGHKIQAKFFHPTGLALDTSNQVLYVADHYNHVIRAVNIKSGKVSTLAGGGRQGFFDGSGEEARFNYPEGIAYDPEYQVLYVAEFDNNAVRMVTLKGEVTTLAGGYLEGYLDGSGGVARFFHPTGLAFDSKRKIIYVTDQYNHVVRSISAMGNVEKVPQHFVPPPGGRLLRLSVHPGYGTASIGSYHPNVRLINHPQESALSISVFIAVLVLILLLTRRYWKPVCFSWRQKPSRALYQ